MPANPNKSLEALMNMQAYPYGTPSDPFEEGMQSFAQELGQQSVTPYGGNIPTPPPASSGVQAYDPYSTGFQAATKTFGADNPALLGLYYDEFPEREPESHRRDIADYYDTVARQKEARMAGFDSPMAAGDYARKMEQQKMNVPIEQARMSGQFDLARQQEASRGGLAVEQERSRGEMERVGKALELQQLQSMLTPGSSMSITGVGSVRQGQVPNINVLLNELTRARQAFQEEAGYFGADPAATARYQSALANALNAHSAPAHLKNLAIKMSTAPEAANMSPADMVSKLRTPGYEMSPAEMQVLTELVRLIKGTI